MPRKDYYVILGIPRDESVEGVRTAYRDLAKRHHPDLAGPAGAGRFREITEAYEVLSDPARRRQHNSELAKADRSSPFVGGPLRRPAGPITSPPPSIFERPDNIHPSLTELFDRYSRNFTGLAVPKAERPEGLNIEVVLTPEEAAGGGVLPVTVPVYHPCAICGGTGEDWPFRCLACGGHGLIERRETVRVNIPRHVRPGSIFELPLSGLGVENFWLRIYIRIGRS